MQTKRTTRTSAKAGLVPPLQSLKRKTKSVTVGERSTLSKRGEQAGIASRSDVATLRKEQRTIFSNSISLPIMAKNSMPRMLSNEAPHWDGRGETLRKYIWQVEKLLATCGITESKEMLDWLLTYVDLDVREEWIEFQEAKDGEYEKFKERLRKEFPETISSERGSVRKIKTICKEYAGIEQNEEGELLSFKRKFLAEANKCLREPAVISNRELVELFSSTLSRDFQRALDARLSINGKTRNVLKPEDLREEDPYDIEEIVNQAIAIASGKTLVRSLQYERARPSVATS